ncbi:hypothetical protein TNCV_2280351 [Trichonephila clavipes]|nr:hypothetical protein TNCV_2280351 [Trichonephila clavipes]
MSDNDSETCHTLHPRKGRKLNTSLAIEQTRPRFANSQVSSKPLWPPCRLFHFHECRNEMESIGERPLFRCKEMS